MFFSQSLDPKTADPRKKHRRQRSTGSGKYMFEGPMKRVFNSIEVVPTMEAEASRYFSKENYKGP